MEHAGEAHGYWFSGNALPGGKVGAARGVVEEKNVGCNSEAYGVAYGAIAPNNTYIRRNRDCALRALISDDGINEP